MTANLFFVGVFNHGIHLNFSDSNVDVSYLFSYLFRTIVSHLCYAEIPSCYAPERVLCLGNHILIIGRHFTQNLSACHFHGMYGSQFSGYL